MDEFDGANAIEPMLSEAFWSPTAVQVAPASVERQIPPCAPPMSTVFPVVSLGSTAMVVTLPLTGEKSPPVVGSGPTDVQAGKEDGLVSGEIFPSAFWTSPEADDGASLPSACIMFRMCCNARNRAPAAILPFYEARCLSNHSWRFCSSSGPS